jgi:serine/threonine protein kinase
MNDPIRFSNDPGTVAAVEAYAKALAEGQWPDRQALLDAHPQVASELNACLDALELVHRFVPDVSDSAQPRTSPPDSARQQPDGDVSRLATLGNFRLLRQIGRGGMGVVYEAQQIDLNRRVALKILPFAAMLDHRQLTRFKNEAQAAAGLHHTNIVPVYSFGSQHGVHYYAMQYIEGQTLAQVIAGFPDRTASLSLTAEQPHDAGQAAMPTETMDVPPAEPSAEPSADLAECPETPSEPVNRDATPPWLNGSRWKSVGWCRRVAEMGIQVAEALEHAHQQGVLHRDIKPSNLLLDVQGNVWVTDFGLAQIEAGTKLMLTGDVLGTLRYMSPEQAGGGSGRVDCRSDVYSLGITLYELLTLQPAFRHQRRELLLAQVLSEDSPPSPSRWNRSIPRDLETIVQKATAKIPSDRYETAARSRWPRCWIVLPTNCKSGLKNSLW